MSVVSTTRPLAWDGRVEGRRMFLFANAGVDADVLIGWYLRAPDDDVISIMFGNEQISLDFHDVESLELLRDVADQAASRLRAVLDGSR